MPEEKKTLKLHYGFLADKLSKQLKEQGFKLPKNIKYLEKCCEAINTLTFINTDSMQRQLQSRLTKEIIKGLKEVN